MSCELIGRIPSYGNNGACVVLILWSLTLGGNCKGTSDSNLTESDISGSFLVLGRICNFIKSSIQVQWQCFRWQRSSIYFFLKYILYFLLIQSVPG